MRMTNYQAMMLWDELARAYHGMNSYGGDVAELYISRCMEHSSIFANNPDSALVKDDLREAGKNIIAVVELFQQRYSCLVTMEEGPLEDLASGEYTWRVHLKVTKGKK